MAVVRKHILYLCLDRGIKIGGTKGASIHIAEFMEALYDQEYTGTLLAARKDKEFAGILPYSVGIIPDGGSLDLPEQVAGLDPILTTEADAKEFCRNVSAEEAIEIVWNEKQFDLIYERYSLFGVDGHLAAKMLGVPHILEVNAPLVLEASAHRNLSAVELAGTIERTLFSSADHIIAVSQGVKDYVLSVAPTAVVTVVPNGVNMKLFATNGSTSGEKLCAPHPMTVGFVGALRPWHGVDILVDAFSRLARKFPDAGLVIVGEGGLLRESLDRQIAGYGIKDRVTFLGAVSHDRIPAILRGMTVATAPYPKLDNFYFSPLKVYEYMAAGRPIVASRIGQVTEILTDGHNGLLVEPGDPVSLAEALGRVLSDPELREKIGAQARADAEREHSWSERMKNIISVFHKV